MQMHNHLHACMSVCDLDKHKTCGCLVSRFKWVRQGLSDEIKKDNQDGEKREIRGSKGEDDEDDIWLLA